MTQLPENEIDVKKLDIQITELLRLELEIQQDIERQKRDFEKVQHQRKLLQTQLKLINERQLGQRKED